MFTENIQNGYDDEDTMLYNKYLAAFLNINCVSLFENMFVQCLCG